MIQTKVFCDRWTRRVPSDKGCLGEIKRNDIFFDIGYGQPRENIQLCRNCMLIFLRDLFEDNAESKLINISRVRVMLP